MLGRPSCRFRKNGQGNMERQRWKKKLSWSKTQVHDDSTKTWQTARLLSESANNKKRFRCYCVPWRCGYYHLICSNVLKNVSEHHWIRKGVRESKLLEAGQQKNNEVEIPVRPTDGVLLGTKAWTVIISLGMMSLSTVCRCFDVTYLTATHSLFYV